MSHHERWNLEPQNDGTLLVCKGDHERAQGCKWKLYEPFSERQPVSAEVVAAHRIDGYRAPNKGEWVIQCRCGYETPVRMTQEQSERDYEQHVAARLTSAPPVDRERLARMLANWFSERHPCGRYKKRDGFEFPCDACQADGEGLTDRVLAALAQEREAERGV